LRFASLATNDGISLNNIITRNGKKEEEINFLFQEKEKKKEKFSQLYLEWKTPNKFKLF
jgi:hypothetical protein